MFVFAGFRARRQQTPGKIDWNVFATCSSDYEKRVSTRTSLIDINSQQTVKNREMAKKSAGEIRTGDVVVTFPESPTKTETAKKEI